MRFIGITGGIGAGKSVVMDYLKNHTCSEVVLADDLAKELMSPGHDLNQKLQKVLSKESFANPVFEEDGTIQKEAFAAYVLSDDRLRESVNALVHPAVKEEVLRRVRAHREKKDVDYFFLEAALLIEDGYKVLCDELWYIYVTEENRRKRLKENRGYDDTRVDEAFRMQLEEYEFLDACCVTIDNNGAKEETYEQLERVLSLRKPRNVEG
ncbi:MAG: dephospho-CoA kinase [Lachnospiraceae bacterium]|nr:dephospho-CoA kinase [Lachnospiraceae bacterium]